METLLAFAPFIVYVVIERIAGIMPGLVSAAIVSFLLLLRDIISPSRTVKILEIGTVILFGGLAAYARFTAATWSIVAVRLRVDAGLLLMKIWGFPTFSSDTYPANGADTRPQTSHPFVLGKFAFEDTNK